ncbi:glycoside hydrolase family 127 protein [Undibacterium sp. 5I1]|uniref:glycoside hydrolase family 127 protein n=1 Tax=unclassified Undibacterium TaxID=2630295 RepID=UPI002AB543A1|nr:MULTISPECIES: beta-L-arabinofuranosidase domain-containing protein [unclassified Undibacterium]MDY7539334.1 glycoside hydrolase family 127 protein [Undibacterium sp. 5I1]MEB0231161.1 glycoside hydrolase family 127 protein [Undibacterium sp. 10I3]MEB0258557.1 glycoside hydrolase family 127 protein [Undibacterium sp. 5I1]
MAKPKNLPRRQMLQGIAGSAFLTSFASASPVIKLTYPFELPKKAAPISLEQVRLLPSPYYDAVVANKAYLLRLKPDRFLHNYHQFAGLPVKDKAYGGWEADTIAGEALGHYLTALSLMYAQTGDSEMRKRVDYIFNELELAQNAQGSGDSAGYIAGFMRKRKSGEIVDGKEIFPEIMAGNIHSAGFDLNGCWVPFYNWHKLFAGLLDAQSLCGNTQALPVALKLAAYIDKVFAALNDEQVQQVLNCEHGGINESFAELYVRSKDVRWLKLAERLYHNKTMVPMREGRDELANLHANTQIPKLIGLARLAEITGERGYEKAAIQFWESVTQHHSYVIGGHGDREYFNAPDTVHQHISEQTCEACGTYNMLKLTRHLFSWRPNAAYFDFYERGHINHILAHQNPKTGMFTYMTPLMSGMPREFSTEEDSFWCCVLSGMESHAKHGDSIYWSHKDCLFVNLYIPSSLNWREQAVNLTMTTHYPFEGNIQLNLDKTQEAKPFAIALRIPGWAKDFSLRVNDEIIKPSLQNGYCLIYRRWKKNDKIRLQLPITMRFENALGQPAKEDESIVAFVRGPLVMAADLGAADKDYKGQAPALVGAKLLEKITPVDGSKAQYQSTGIMRPEDLRLQPFYAMYERRAAVYFNRFTDAQWLVAADQYHKELAELKAIAERSVDIMHLGEMQAERDHQLESAISYPVSYRGRNGRDARTGGFFSFKMKVKPGKLELQATYWGEERNRRFSILVDQQEIAKVELNGRQPGVFFDQTYTIPEALSAGKSHVIVRFQPETGYTAGPAFSCRIMEISKLRA